MANQNVPTGITASLKVLADAVRDTFGAAIIIEGFLGIALISLSMGGSNLGSESRSTMMFAILGLMVSVLILLFIIRIWKPSGLGGPPSPLTEDVIFKDSSAS